MGPLLVRLKRGGGESINCADEGRSNIHHAPLLPTAILLMGWGHVNFVRDLIIIYGSSISNEYKVISILIHHIKKFFFYLLYYHLTNLIILINK